MVERRFVAVDLFCGAGGFSLGAIAAGFRIALAVDNNAHACLTYRKNIVLTSKGKTKIINGDLGLLTAEDLIKQSPELRSGCDLIIGGPPCQGFSSHRLRDTGVGDPRNSLLIRYFEIVSVLTPKFFLVENVPGLLWPRHRNWLDKFYAMAIAGGYQVSSATSINAADYGIPQRRKRVFILGTRKDISTTAFPPLATHCDPATALQNGLLPWVPAKGVFKKSKITGDPNDVHMRHNAELKRAFKSTPINGGSRFQSGRTLRCHAKHDGHFDVYGRIDPAVPAPTMTTACINPSKGRFVHPTAPHGITIRQAARIQTFPDWFVFEGGLMASGEQIGNAVPPILAEIFLRSLRDQLRATASADQQAA